MDNWMDGWINKCVSERIGGCMSESLSPLVALSSKLTTEKAQGSDIVLIGRSLSSRRQLGMRLNT